MLRTKLFCECFLVTHVENYSFNLYVPRSPSEENRFLRHGKNFEVCVDVALECCILVVPLEAGLHYVGVRSTYILGLQIGLNFVPATKTETRDCGQTVSFVGMRLSFFCVQNVMNRWFFDIYIQGSKKYNFKS
jgi:hypothetical protein